MPTEQKDTETRRHGDAETSASDSLSASPRLPVSESSELFLRYRGYGIKFHTNICGKVYSLTTDEQATRFTSAEAAAIAADQNKIPWTECVLVIFP